MRKSEGGARVSTFATRGDEMKSVFLFDHRVRRVANKRGGESCRRPMQPDTIRNLFIFSFLLLQ